MSKILNKSAIQPSSSIGKCPNHPKHELAYFNAKVGRKQCLMCIMHTTMAEGGKDRFCIKHPGFENSFFCNDDQKSCCQKCLCYHKRHKVESTALKAEMLKEKFEDYKRDFVDSSKQWKEYYNEVKVNKASYDKEINKAGKTIEDIFDKMINHLKKKKTEAVANFKKQAATKIKRICKEFDECGSELEEINRHNVESVELEELFKSDDNMEIVVKSTDLGIDELLDNYCEEIDEKLKNKKTKFDEIKNKISKKFLVQNNYKEAALNEFIEKQYTINMGEDEVSENIEELPEDNAEEKKDIDGSFKNEENIKDTEKSNKGDEDAQKSEHNEEQKSQKHESSEMVAGIVNPETTEENNENKEGEIKEEGITDENKGEEKKEESATEEKKEEEENTYILRCHKK